MNSNELIARVRDLRGRLAGAAAGELPALAAELRQLAGRVPDDADPDPAVAALMVPLERYLMLADIPVPAGASDALRECVRAFRGRWLSAEVVGEIRAAVEGCTRRERELRGRREDLDAECARLAAREQLLARYVLLLDTLQPGDGI